jgi:hypothetical protein
MPVRIKEFNLSFATVVGMKLHTRKTILKKKSILACENWARCMYTSDCVIICPEDFHVVLTGQLLV